MPVRNKKRARRKDLVCPLCRQIVDSGKHLSAFDVLVMDYGLIALASHLRDKHRIIVPISAFKKAKTWKKVVEIIVDTGTKQAFDPAGPTIDFEIEEMSEVDLRGRYCVMAKLRTLRAIDVSVRTPAFITFTIGTLEDPEARQASTWAKSIGARQLKHFLRAAGAEDWAPTVRELLHEAEGKTITLNGKEMDAFLGMRATRNYSA